MTNTKKSTDAINHVGRAVSLTDSIQIRLHRALVLLGQNITKAIDRGRKHVQVLNARATRYEITGQPTLAMSDYAAALALQPDR
jgi:Tfp pilus assembly protein PilF